MKVGEVMQPNLIVIHEEATVQELVDLLAKKEISGVPVVNADEKLVGVVSLSDLARAVSAKSVSEHEYYVNPSWGTTDLTSIEPGDQRVSEIMTKLVLDVQAEDDLVRVADMMVNFGVHRIIVTRENSPVGVVTAIDMVGAFRDRLKKGNSNA